MEQLTNLQAAINILKVTIGLGVLSLPYGTMRVGWLPSMLLMPVMALMNVCGIFYAVKAKQKHEAKLKKDGETCLEPGEGTHLLQAAGKGKRHEIGLGFFDELAGEVLGWPAQACCAIMICFGQLSTGITYIKVIVECWQVLAKDKSVSSRRDFQMLLAAVLCSLTAMKTLRRLSVISGCGLLTYAWIAGVLIYQSAEKLGDGSLGHTATTFAEQPSFAAWYGVSAFAFASFPVAIGVFGEMKDQSSFFWTTSLCYALICGLYMAISLMGYLCYGSKTEEVVMLNLPPGSAMSISANVSLSLVLVFTFPVQLHPVYNCLEHFLEEKVHYAVLRCTVVVLLVLLANVFQDTALLMEGAGAICFGVPCLIFPSIVYMTVEPRPGMLESICASSLILAGLYGSMVFFLR